MRAYRNNIGVKIGAAIILLGAVLFFSASGLSDPIRQISAKFFSSLASGVRAVSEQFGRNPRALLEEENERLRSAAFDIEKFKKENDALRRALDMKEGLPIRLKGASVLLRVREFGKEFLVVDQGGEGGIVEGAAAVDEHLILLGFVREVDEYSSRISLLSNPGEAAQVVLAPRGIKALAKGIGARTLSVDLVPHAKAVNIGDYVSFFIPGAGKSVLAALVVSVEPASASAFQAIRATMAARPEVSEIIFVILPLPRSR